LLDDKKKLVVNQKKDGKTYFPFFLFFLTVFLAPDVVSSLAMSSVFAFLPLVSVLTDDVAHLCVVNEIEGDRRQCLLHVVDPCDHVSGMVLEECVVVDGAG